MPHPEKKPHVLIIDDDAPIAEVLEVLLRTEGVATTVCTNGREALDALLQKPREFSGIILDWRMPVMDGGQFLQEIEKAKLKIPVLISSASDNINTSLYSCVVGKIPKPFDIDSLLKTVRARFPAPAYANL